MKQEKVIKILKLIKMKIPLSELIDKMAIIKLKIERVGEPHLQKEYIECKKAVKKYESKYVKIEKVWFNKLYNINGKIWDIEFDLREIVNKLNNNIGIEINDEELEEIGKKHLIVGKLMKKRNTIKNEIVDKTGEGYKIIKVDHSDE